MGYNKIAELTHEMEDVLDLIRKEQLKLDEDIIDTLFKCLDSLEQMIDRYRYREIILATNPTVEGDATAHFIGHIAAKYQIPVSQIARGIPVGGELDAIDGSTLMRSFAGRRPL